MSHVLEDGTSIHAPGMEGFSFSGGHGKNAGMARSIVHLVRRPDFPRITKEPKAFVRMYRETIPNCYRYLVSCFPWSEFKWCFVMQIAMLSVPNLNDRDRFSFAKRLLESAELSCEAVTFNKSRISSVQLIGLKVLKTLGQHAKMVEEGISWCLGALFFLKVLPLQDGSIHLRSVTAGLEWQTQTWQLDIVRFSENMGHGPRIELKFNDRAEASPIVLSAWKFEHLWAGN